MNYIDQIIETINTSLASSLDCPQAVIYGLTELITKDGKTFPIQVQGAEGCEIVFDDRKPLQIYHRLIDVRKEASPLSGVGDQIYEAFTAQVRLFGIGNKDSFTPMCMESNLEWANKVDIAIIRKFTPGITGFTNVRIGVSSMNSHQSEIIEAEFKGFSTQKLNPLKVIAFSIDYSITGFICENVCV